MSAKFINDEFFLFNSSKSLIYAKRVVTVEQKKRKDITKRADKSAKKRVDKKSAMDLDSDNYVDVSYKKPKISTGHVYESEESVKIEEINQGPESIPIQEKKDDSSSSSEDKSDDSDDDGKDKNSGVFIWIAIIVILALIILIVNLDRIMPANKVDVKNPVSNIVATVNGQDITSAELDKYYNLSVPDLMKSSISKATFLEKSMIPQKVLLQEAQKNGILVSDDEISQQLTQLAESAGMTKEDFLARLDKQGIKEEDVLLLYKNKLVIDKLLDKALLSDAQIDLPDMVKASHILVDNEDLAKALLAKIKSGASFEDLAMNNSMDSTAANGGDLGYFAQGSMVPEFEDAAFALDVGQVSDVVKTEFGYHIIKVTDKLAGGTVKYSDIKNNAQKQFAINAQMPSIQTYTKMLVEKSDIKMINGTSTVSVKTTTTLAKAATGIVNADKLADCIKGKAVLYGAEWCQPCAEQKKLFGASFSKIDYIVCTASVDNPQTDKCELAGVVKYPTWIINGQKLEGKQSLESLASAAGCAII